MDSNEIKASEDSSSKDANYQSNFNRVDGGEAKNEITREVSPEILSKRKRAISTLKLSLGVFIIFLAYFIYQYINWTDKSDDFLVQIAIFVLSLILIVILLSIYDIWAYSDSHLVKVANQSARYRHVKELMFGKNPSGTVSKIIVVILIVFWLLLLLFVLGFTSNHSM
jgi:hypothetical protein